MLQTGTVVQVQQKCEQLSGNHLLDCAVPSPIGDAIVPSITEPFLVLVGPFVTPGCFPVVDGAI